MQIEVSIIYLSAAVSKLRRAPGVVVRLGYVVDREWNKRWRARVFRQRRDRTSVDALRDEPDEAEVLELSSAPGEPAGMLATPQSTPLLHLPLPH